MSNHHELRLDDVVVHHQGESTLDETSDHHDHLTLLLNESNESMSPSKSIRIQESIIRLYYLALRGSKEHKAQRANCLVASVADSASASLSFRPVLLEVFRRGRRPSANLTHRVIDVTTA